MTDNYGRAEFGFCPSMFRGKMLGVFICRIQQIKKPDLYFAPLYGGKHQAFRVSDAREDFRLDPMGPWRVMPCSSHGLMLEYYVRDGMTKLTFKSSSISADFLFS